MLFSKVVTYLSQGSFFGEMAFMLPGKRRTADVHAVKDCELFSLKKDHLDNVLIHFPEVREWPVGALLHKRRGERYASRVSPKGGKGGRERAIRRGAHGSRLAQTE